MKKACCYLMSFTLIVAVTLALAAVPYANATSFDAATQFDPTNNPSLISPWSYGFETTLGGAFILYTTPGSASTVDFWIFPPITSLGAPTVAHNGTAVSVSLGTPFYGPGQLGLHPGPIDQISIVRFTAPANGTYDLAASFTGIDTSGTTTDVHVLVNDVSIFNGTVNGFGAGSGPSFAAPQSLVAGGRIDFAVGFGTNASFFNDSTGLDATLTQRTSSAIPEPSTWLLLATGCAGLLGYGWRVFLGSGLVALAAWRRKQTV